MRPNPWRELEVDPSTTSGERWLERILSANVQTAYLSKYGSPRSQQAFRASVPVVRYEDLRPWMTRVEHGEADVLFTGRPVAFERTGGSTGSSKLIPYSAPGLDDFRRALLPWLVNVVKSHNITGKAYLSISPATRRLEAVADIPVGLPDGAYLGEASGTVLAQVSAVPFAVSQIADVDRWRAETVHHLRAAGDLQLISVWSPTFLLELLKEIDQPAALWPELKLVSCWASGASKPFADTLAALLPHAHLQPKGLLSTETVVTVPDEDDRPALTRYGFFEFEREGRLHLEHELGVGKVYEVIATTASGLYRYRTGDYVRFDGGSVSGRPVLEFIGRGALVSDLVGEKLTESFVAGCLADIDGFRLLVPTVEGDGYVLAAEAGVPVNLSGIERRLCDNPQYAYARQLGQLKALRLQTFNNLFERYAQANVQQGVRLGDVKPISLRNERTWIARLNG
jgi:hypothetical protein